MIYNKNGEAIAFFGSTTMTTPPAQMKWVQSFYDELSNHLKRPYHDVRLGDISLNAKIAVKNDAYSKDMVRSFTLFGDPSMQFPV